MRVRPTYSEQFKTDALTLLDETDRTLTQVARDLGVAAWTLRAWYNKREMAKRTKRKPLAASAAAGVPSKQETWEERAQRLERENGALRKRVDSLEMDREILKKAAAFFAKESE